MVVNKVVDGVTPRALPAVGFEKKSITTAGSNAGGHFTRAGVDEQRKARIVGYDAVILKRTLIGFFCRTEACNVASSGRSSISFLQSS